MIEVFLTFVSRVIVHPANFTALGAFAATNNKNKYSILTTLFVVWLSDIVVNLIYYPDNIVLFGDLWIYLSYMLITLLSYYTNTLLLPVMSSVVFFLLSNFGVYASGYYGYTINGLVNCYLYALPFYTNTLLGDVFYTYLIFQLNKYKAYEFI